MNQIDFFFACRFDFASTNLNDEHLEKVKEDSIPNIVSFS